jgi:transposase InsO family protein
LILQVMQQAQERTGQSVGQILAQLSFPSATYYRWQMRQRQGQLADQVVTPQRIAPVPTPEEKRAVCRFAVDNTRVGYKRLAWQMVDEDLAYLRPYQVYDILKVHELLSRCDRPQSDPLRRPAEPDHPDQVWHLDLMYLYVAPRWYYLVDILDGYSRFLVHWSLNLTMLADTVTLTVQEALDRLSERRPGEPKLVHDHGSQFLSTEWRAFIAGSGVTDIKTRVAHPQSNGRLERLHRTHREEGLIAELLEAYHQALRVMGGWSDYYNYRRPHSALRYLCPADYYRGNPEARLAERERKLAQAVEARKAYWAGVWRC